MKSEPQPNTFQNDIFTDRRSEREFRPEGLHRLLLHDLLRLLRALSHGDQLSELASSHRAHQLGGLLSGTVQGSFSAVSKPNFASKYAFESSRRDLHDALLCTALQSHFFCQHLPEFAKVEHCGSRQAWGGVGYSSNCRLQ